MAGKLTMSRSFSQLKTSIFRGCPIPMFDYSDYRMVMKCNERLYVGIAWAGLAHPHAVSSVCQHPEAPTHLKRVGWWPQKLPWNHRLDRSIGVEIMIPNRQWIDCREILPETSENHTVGS